MKRYVVRVSIFLTTAALIAGMVGCDYSPPPIQKLEIRTWYDLDAVRNNLEGSYILVNNLDSTTPGYHELASPAANQGKGWEPIGLGWFAWSPFGIKEIGEIFKGILDGQGYEIRDMYINNSGGQVGLFGFVAKGGIFTEGGVVKNIGLANATVTTGEAIGEPLRLERNTVKALDVGAVGGVGGLVGYNGGTVSNCYGMANITGGWGVGGLIGRNHGTVSNCYAMVNITGDSGLGGLVAYNEGVVRDCYSTGTVSGEGYGGGLAAGNEGTVDNSFWDTQTSGQATSAGGTGKTTVQMKDISTFSSAGWNITAVANPGVRNPSYIWNIVDGVTYPFLSWEA
jgi:hypothetical protein